MLFVASAHLVHWLFWQVSLDPVQSEVTQQLPGTHFRAQQKSVALLGHFLSFIVHTPVTHAPVARSQMSAAPYVASAWHAPSDLHFPQKLGLSAPQISPVVQSVSARQSPGAQTPARQSAAGGYAALQVASSVGSLQDEQMCPSHRPFELLTSHAEPFTPVQVPAAAPLSVPESAFVPLSFAAPVSWLALSTSPVSLAPVSGVPLLASCSPASTCLPESSDFAESGFLPESTGLPASWCVVVPVSTPPSTPGLELVLLPHPWASSAMALPATMAHVNGLSPL